MLRNGVRFSAFAALLLGAVCLVTAQGPWNWDISIEARGRGETRENRDFSDNVDDHVGDGLGRLRIGFHVYNPDEGVAFFLMPQEAYDQYWTPAANNNTHQFDLFQGWAQWQSPDETWRVRGGRQAINFGDERLVGEFGWGNIGRSWDAARMDYRNGAWTFTGFGGTIGVNGIRPTHPDLYGVHASTAHRSGDLNVYWFQKHDSAAGASIDVSTVGARFTHRRGDFDAKVEGALQFGDNQGKDIEAGAVAAVAGVTFGSKWKPRIGVEAVWASGGDPADTKVKTFDQLYPTNHYKYGIIDYQGWRNVLALKGEVSFRPAADWGVNLAYWTFDLDDERDFWYGSGGAPNVGLGGAFRDPTGAAGKNVGDEFDVIVSYNAGPHWFFEAGYAHFMPGSFIEALNGDDDPSDWGYLQVTWKY